jgi:polyisoprenyl-phosphate glycosyltransferase
MIRVDVVVPVYQEADCLDELLRRLLDLRSRVPAWEMRFILVNDGSRDRSQEILERHAAANPCVQVIKLSRNFGHQAAVTAGLDQADADWVAIIDADLQDPPEHIRPMVERAMQGYDVVYGQRSRREGETLFKRATASVFYGLIRRLCQVDIPPETGDFRVIGRRVVRALREMREQHRFIRGLVPWVGFRAVAYPYDRDQRFAGATKYPLVKMLKFALDAVFSFSNYPLRLATWLGLLMAGFGAVIGLVLLYLRLFTPYTVPGITAVILIVVIMVGLQNIALGIVGEYVGRIFEEVKRRPLYVVEHTVNLPARDE